jgi:hypothetical protein
METVALELENKTIAKLAIAIATAVDLQKKEVGGPLIRKVLATLDTIDATPHFDLYTPRN